MSETTAYSNHIKNSELETREVFEQETEDIPLTQQTDLVTQLHYNLLTRSTDSSINEERHEPEVNPDPEPSFVRIVIKEIFIRVKIKEEETQQEEKVS